MKKRTPETNKVKGRRSRLCSPIAVAVVLLALGVLASACGGGASPGVAALGSTTTTTSVTQAQAGSPAQAGNKAPGQQAIAFANCMRTHGVPAFPEPQITSHSVSIRVGPGTGVDPKSKSFQSASAACRSFLPKGGGVGPTITPADQADYLKGVACMRSHGFPAFPDPTISKNSVQFTIPSSINQNSTQFKSAVTTCEKLIPAGLPYSGTS